MFYCDECATKKGWPQGIFKSMGKCECCSAVAPCNDTPSSQLPPPKDGDLDPNDKRIPMLVALLQLEGKIEMHKKGLGLTSSDIATNQQWAGMMADLEVAARRLDDVGKEMVRLINLRKGQIDKNGR